MSRLASPSKWKVMRKSIKWIAKTSPGPRGASEAVPLVVLLRDVEGIVENKRELKVLINSKSILINGKRYNDTNFPIGLFDVISFPTIKKQYRAVLNEKGKLIAKEISEKESNLLQELRGLTTSFSKISHCSDNYNSIYNRLNSLVIELEDISNEIRGNNEELNYDLDEIDNKFILKCYNQSNFTINSKNPK